MRTAALTTVALALVAPAPVTAASPNAASKRCVPRSGEIILRQETRGAVSDYVYYRDSVGRPVRGGKALQLCNGVRYRIIPTTAANCVITVPSTATSAAALEREIGRQAKLKRCVPPLLTRVLLEGGIAAEGRQVLRVVPSGKVNIAYRREILAVVPGDPIDPPPSCEVGALPESAKTVLDMVAFYSSQPLQSGCPPVAPSILQNGNLRPVTDVKRDMPIAQTWPARDSGFDTRNVRPLWIAAASLEQVVVPNLVDKTVANARSAARDLGLPPPVVSVDGLLVEGPEADERIIAAQSPKPEAQVASTERLFLTVRPFTPDKPTSAAPAALLATGALSGLAGTALLRGVMRRRRREGWEETPRQLAQPTKPSVLRARPRPDLPPPGHGRSDSKSLATILPLQAISTGLLLTHLEATYPDLIEWSRTDGSADLPPRKLADAIIQAMPEAFAANITDAIVKWWHGLETQIPVSSAAIIIITNEPCIEILLPFGEANWIIQLRANLNISSSEAILRQYGHELQISDRTIPWNVESNIELYNSTDSVIVATGRATILLPSKLQI